MCEQIKRPIVSVIMPAYNAGAYIEVAIRSVMAQTVQDWELLVLDDGSSDDTCAVVQRLAEEDQRVKLIRNPENLGAAQTRNRGFTLSVGEYVALLDSDDVWMPEKLEKQLAEMEQKGADFSCTSYAVIDGDGNQAKTDYLVPENIDYDRLLWENVIGCSTVVLRRELIEKHQFCPDYFHEDYVLWLQLLQQGYRAIGCTQVLAQWRYIATSRSFNKVKSARNRWKIYRNYLKLPLLQSIRLFCAYAVAGFRKYAG